MLDGDKYVMIRPWDLDHMYCSETNTSCSLWEVGLHSFSVMLETKIANILKMHIFSLI